jgi:hypothetical protein
MTKYRPNCAKMGCENISDCYLVLPRFGHLWFCAKHTLNNLQWESVYEMETIQ